MHNTLNARNLVTYFAPGETIILKDGKEIKIIAMRVKEDETGHIKEYIDSFRNRLQEKFLIDNFKNYKK